MTIIGRVNRYIIAYARDFSKDCDIYIIGGEKVYNEAIEKDIVDEIILTRIKSTVIDADAFFPNLNYDTKWKINRIQSFSEGFGKEYDICYIDRR